MKKSEPRSKNVIHREVTVTETLVRTASLVALTLVFASAFRFWQPAIRLAQHMAGTSFWQSLYGLFHIESGLGREQLILSGIVVVCFLLALLVQTVGLLVFRKIRERRN